MSSVEAWIAACPGDEKYLGDTVASLREQGIEPGVINDGRPAHEKWNEAMGMCTSNYLTLPHCGDIYLPGWAKELSTYLDTHPDVVAVFCLDYLIDEQGRHMGQTCAAWEGQDTYSFRDLFELDMKHGNVLRSGTVMFNCRILREARYPDMTLCGAANDVQFWYELAAKYPVGIVMKPLVKSRVDSMPCKQKNVAAVGVTEDVLKARLHASKLRPQDVDIRHVIALTRQLAHFKEVTDAGRVRERQCKGCEFLVCQEAPDNAGTGVVVAHRVRMLNKADDGLLRYYVYPAQGKEIEFGWEKGVPVVKCPVGAFGVAVKKLNPLRIEYHHLLKWPMEILNVSCARKEMWLHDASLWCATYHSVHRDGFVCHDPESRKCADCSRVNREVLEKKAAFLAEALPRLDRWVANSEYLAGQAKRHLGIDCEVVYPSGEPLEPRPRRKRVAYFGAFGVVKGTPVLLKAWRMLEGEAQLLLFCDVPPEWKVGGKLAGYDDVLVMGGYQRQDLPELCNLVDIVVVPSINESYGMVKREIEGLGIPVVATEAGGMDGTVPANDPVALAAAIRAALQAGS